MRVMGWSWDDLQATPLYVRRYSWDFACMQVAHENDEIERAERKAQR